MKTITITAVGEVEEKKSRFIGYLVPYSDFDETLTLLKADNPKANHFITAFRFTNDQGQIVEGCKDDGEPSGTSGPPVLKVLQGHDLINAGAIIVRYFGGTKLGKGGLSRAYSAGVKAAIDKASLIEWVELHQREYKVIFNEVNKLEDFALRNGLEILSRDYIETGGVFTVEASEQMLDALNNHLFQL